MHILKHCCVLLKQNSRSQSGCQPRVLWTWRRAPSPPNLTWLVQVTPSAAPARRHPKSRTGRRTTVCFSRCLRTSSTTPSFCQGTVYLTSVIREAGRKGCSVEHRPVRPPGSVLFCTHEETCCVTSRAAPVRLWLFCCRSNGGTGGRQVLAGSNLGDKQIQERHVISESEGPGVAHTRSCLCFCCPQQGLTSVLLSFCLVSGSEDSLFFLFHTPRDVPDTKHFSTGALTAIHRNKRKAGFPCPPGNLQQISVIN